MKIKNYKIDTTLLPKVWVTWETTKNREFYKRIWLNCQTGKRSDKPESWMYYPSEGAFKKGYSNSGHIGVGWYTQNSDKVWVNNGNPLRYAYLKYHPDIDMLELAAVEMSTTRADEPHNWQYAGDRFFIDRDKNVTVVNGANHYSGSYNLYEFHSAYNMKHVLSMWISLNSNDKLISEFKKFIGKDHFVIGNGRNVRISAKWHVQEWFNTKTKRRGTGKKQTDLDKLVALSLSDASHLSTRAYKGKQYPVTTVAYFEYINDDIGIIRVFAGVNEGKFNETYRMYVRSNGKHILACLSEDGWVPTTRIFKNYGEEIVFANIDEAVSKCKRIQYAAEAIKNFREDAFIPNLIEALKTPVIEQLVKLGCENIAKNVIGSHTYKADLKYTFGGYYNEKAKGLLNQICLTKPQLDIYMKKKYADIDGYHDFRCNERGLGLMRYVFGDDLRHMDIKSFERYLNGFATLEGMSWRSMKENLSVCLPLIDPARFLKNIVRIGEKQSNTYRLLNDTLNEIRYDYNTPEFDWYFDDYSDLVRVHDTLIQLRVAREAERRAYWDRQEAERRKKEDERRKKVDEERKHYEYEDENFIIRLPRDVQEIITEGTKQSICIGGYTNRHSTGGTNLFFIRRKDNAEVPFYAIEMSNDKVIVQIHGFGNRWLGNNPEAIPTVVRWLRKHDIKCDQKILTCTSVGYGRVDSYIEMPIVD